MMKPLITIIIPVYNVKQYLEKCMSTVLAQTYENLEILLVDDGSKDGSEKLCDEYAGKDARVRVIHKVNGGAASARNAALDVAKGEYIGFVDSDDWIEPNMFEVLLNAIERNHAQIAFCANQRVFREQMDNDLTDSEIVMEGEDVLTSFVNPAYKPHILKAVWDKLYRKDLIGDIRFRIGQHEDGDFNTKVLLNTKKVVYCGQVLYHYLDERQGSVTNTGISDHIFEDRLPVLREQIADLKRAGRLDLVERQQVMYGMELLKFYDKISRSDHEKKSRYLDKIRNLVREDADELKKSFSYSQAGKGYILEMKLFLLSPVLFTFYKKLRT